MASNLLLKKYNSFSIVKARDYVKRFVHDVLVYTLSKFGLPDDHLPCTSQKENDYPSPDFMQSAGLTTLRICLLLREKWKEMFQEMIGSSGLNEDNIGVLFRATLISSPLSWSDTDRSSIFLSLAIGNELVLFLDYTEITDINLEKVLDLVVRCVLATMPTDVDMIESLQEIVSTDFVSHKSYIEWLSAFIDRNAIPYDSEEDVSELFFIIVKLQWEKYCQHYSATPTVSEMKCFIGFLPFDMFSRIAYPELTDLPDRRYEASEQNLSDDNESSEVQNFPIPVREVVEAAIQILLDKLKSGDDGRPTRSENVSEQAAQGGDELSTGDDLGERNLAVVASLSGDNESSTSQNLPPNPGSEAVGGKESRDDERPNQSENVSEQAAQGGEELGIQDNLRERNLAAAIFQPSQGAIPKRRKPTKDSRGKQSTSSDIASKQKVQSKKKKKDASKQKLEYEIALGLKNLVLMPFRPSQKKQFGNLSLAYEEVFQLTQDAIPKSRSPIQEIPKRRKPIKESRGKQSTAISEQIAQSWKKLGIEEDFGNLSLAHEEVFQLTQDAIPKSRSPIQEILVSQSTQTDSGSERTPQSGRDLEIEDGLGKTILEASEEASQASLGAVWKRKKPKNKKKKKW